MPLQPLGLPPVLPPSDREWVSSGIKKNRPTNCSFCRFSYKSVGFTPNFVGRDPKIGLVFPHPDKEEVLTQQAFDSARGRRFIHEYLEPLGMDRENLVISYVIRCLPPWSKKLMGYEYPGAKFRQNAEAVCRRYDNLKGLKGELVSGGLSEWNPDLFIFSFDPADTMKIPAYHRLIGRCIDKAAHFANCGYRPVVLFGEESVAVQAPWVKTSGGLKAWQGGYVEQSWRTIPDAEYEAKKNAFIKGSKNAA